MLALLGPLAGASGETPRYSGVQLDPSHRLLIKQVMNLLEIGVVTRGRIPEGKIEHPEHPTAVPSMTSKDILVRVKSEVLIPAAPNNFRNPGQRYRVTVEGVSVAPGYVSIKEVDAVEARAYLLAEFDKLRARAQGLTRDALYYAGLSAAATLNESGYFPAEIPLSELKSPTSKTRIGNKTFQRKSLQSYEKMQQQQQELAAAPSDSASPNE